MTVTIKHPLDQNGTIDFILRYDPESKTLKGGISAVDVQHASDDLHAHLHDITSIVIDGKPVFLEQPENIVGPQEYSASFQYKLKDDQQHIPVEIKLNNQTFGTYTLDTQAATLGGRVDNSLAAFETRLLAGSKGLVDIPYDRSQKPPFTPTTDLHTHLAGNLSSKKLIELALSKTGDPVMYAAGDLEKLGIETNVYTQKDGKIAIGDLNTYDLTKLEVAMAIPVDKQDTFNGMETIYQYRGPITKDKGLFKDILREIARDYAASGTKYAELSHASIITDPDLLRMAHEVLPEIEQETGVKLRFLAAMWRHSDKEWNQDEVDRIKAIAESPYVVGADFMGHESNPTRDFASEIKEIAKWSVVNDPDFTIRVHAGENPLFAAAGFKNAQETPWDFHNVKEVLQAVVEARKEVADQLGVSEESLPMPRVRIGHGLYGLDEETIALFKKTGAVVEFNMSSNLALNNINDISEIPIQRYVDAGIPVVLGHDGKGIYKTDPTQEAFLAQAAGITAEGFMRMEQTETSHIARDAKRFAAKNASFEQKLDELRSTGISDEEVFKQATNATYSTPDKKPRMTREVSDRYRAAQASQEADLLSRVSTSYNGQPAATDPQQVAANLEGKTPILITGASEKSWPKIAEQDQQEIKLAMQVLSNWVDPDKAYLITGGTHHGAEARLHEAAHITNLEAADGKKLHVLGAFTAEALALKSGQVSKVANDTFTDATILKMNGRISQRWFDLQDAALDIVDRQKGSVIALGGGPVVSDMIQRAHNMGLDMHLMDGPAGASSDKSKSLRSNGYNFVGAEGLLEHLHQSRPELFKPGFDASKVAEYVNEAAAQIDRNTPGSDMVAARGQQIAQRKAGIGA